MTRVKRVLIVLSAFGLSACALSKPNEEYSTTANRTSIDRANAVLSSELSTGADQEEIGSSEARAVRVPALTRTSASVLSADGDEPALGDDPVDAVVAPLPLPQFIDVAFGQVLRAPYVTGERVATRTDVIQLRSSGLMPPATFIELVKTALSNYGVSVIADGGVYQIVEDASLKSRMPRFIRSRARAASPISLRPIVQFVELQAIQALDMSRILEQAFASRDERLKIEADEASNYLILSGLPDEIDAAMLIVEEMDELNYAGTQAIRYTPRFWEAAALTREVLTILDAEGWQASGTSARPLPILMLSIPYSNDILIFSRTPEARARTMFWIRDLDRPTQRTNGEQIFVYNVRNIDAAALAETAGAAIEALGTGGNQPRRPGGGGGGGGQQQGDSDSRGGGRGGARGATVGRFVVDPYGNRLIFSGDANEYDQIRQLLETLDTPTPEVLIEVMVAQVQLSDSISSGVEWVVENLGGSLDGLFRQSPIGLGATGVVFSVFPAEGDEPTVSLSALATNSKVDVLSTPRIVARSGTSAQVQVGSEVPILSAQRLPQGTAGNTNVDVISSVEYRSTGVILQIEPIVFSDDRIDLALTQEISATISGSGDISSPTFSNTSVQTQLSLEDGATAVIGGLISDNVSRDEQGVPFLKDIPFVGNAFSSRSTGVDRTELVILITAYVMRDRDEKRLLADELTRQIDETLAADTLVTLRPRQFE